MDHGNDQIKSTSFAAISGAARCEVNNYRDDGTFATGMIMAFLMALSGMGGYWVRDIGITFRVDQVKPVTQQEVKR